MKRHIRNFFLLSVLGATLSIGASAQADPLGPGGEVAPQQIAGQQIAGQQVGTQVTATQVTGLTVNAGNLQAVLASQLNPQFGGQGMTGLGFGFNRSGCGNVIQMLMQSYFSRGFVPPVAQGGWVMGPAGPMFIQGPGDLQLLDVQMISDGGPQQGPLYQVSFRNNSKVMASNFRISLVAVLGQIQQSSPIVTVDVPQVAAGQIGTVQVQTPALAMAMGPAGNVVPFDTLVVALDSFHELIESNELNNIAVLKRADVTIFTAETAVTTTATTTTAVQGVAGGAVAGVAGGIAGGAAPVIAGQGVAGGIAGGPAGGAAPGPITTPGSTVAPQPGISPNDNAAPAPRDPASPGPSNKIDFDNFDFGDATNAAGPTTSQPSIAPQQQAAPQQQLDPQQQVAPQQSAPGQQAAQGQPE
jgi:hypothetical protein